MRDVYLYEDCGVLKNLLHIKDKTLLDEAEADYLSIILICWLFQRMQKLL